jgi:hypothetical protein
MSTSSAGHGDYYQAIGEETDRLWALLSEIARLHDAGELTVRQAADARVAALENHLAALRQLRADHLGDGS